MARQETKYIVIHCSQTRPSQDVDAKWIDRVHRERGWTMIGYGKVIKRDGTVEQGRQMTLFRLTSKVTIIVVMDYVL